MSTSLELIHFNDVYHVAPAKDEPVGGTSRFVSKINQVLEESDDKPLVLFSGDAFNPSLEGSITRGTHVPGMLNQCHITAACLGNHDFDFGMPQLEKLMGKTNFPWLLSNVLKENKDVASKDIKRFLIQEHNGLRIGIIGLVEKEWIETIPSFPPELIYFDFIEVAQDLSRQLRDPNGPYKVDLIIALTHMRVPNDVKLASECHEEIDLILGGHDHFYYVTKAIEIVGDHWSRENNLADVGFDPEKDLDGFPVYVVKSGTDFREFSYLKLELGTDEKTGRKRIQHMKAERNIVTADITPDPETEKLVIAVTEQVASKTATPIGYTTVPLDGRSMSVRTEETNLGNFTADLMVGYYRSIHNDKCPTGAEIGFCVGGTIRNDSIIEAGEITLGDILTAFPFDDPVVVIRIKGKQLWDALENSVSEYPKQEGRFPQLSGLRLEWNPNRPPGERVRRVYTVKSLRSGRSGSKGRRRSLSLPEYTNPADKYLPENMVPLDFDQEYIMAVRNYLVKGYDGYTSLKVPEEDIIIDEESGVLISTMYRKYFLGLKYINAFKEHQAKHAHDEKRIKEFVLSAANHWRKLAQQFKRHDHSDDSDSCSCDTDSQQGQSFLNSDIHDRASYHITREGISDAFVDSSRGHPTCIDAEEDEDHGSNKKYDKENEISWVKRWASIAPTVEGRIVRVDD